MLVRGESVIASTGLALAAIFTLAIAGAAGWTVYAEREAARRNLERDLGACARILAASAEPHLASATGAVDLRTLLVRAAAEHRLTQCRVVLANGTVIAEGNDAAAGSAESGATVLTASAPVTVPGQGAGEVQVAGALKHSFWVGLEAQTGIGVIGAAAFTAFLITYRRLRARLRAVGAIREALMAAARGEASAAVLSVNEQFGPEAAAWNALLAERERLRQEATTERAREALGNRADVRSDLAHACDALWQGMMLLDEKLTIKYANGAAAVFLRAEREKLAGTAIGDHIADADLLAAIQGVASGQVRRRSTIEVRRSDADAVGVLRFSVRPVRRNDAAAALVMIEDVTQQRVADEARNAFVAQATHELRTPLTNIRLYVEQAIEAGDEDPTVRAKALDVINQESRRLERIVGDMLSVSEIEAGSFKLRAGDVRLENLFDDLKAEYEAQAREKNITLTLRLPPKLPVIKGDRDKIVLALHNLLGNAVKYTPEGGSVEVRVSTDNDRLNVEVADTGIGINPDETELIFEKFYRAKDKRVNQITGTGLGLALAREVVRLHGGDITVQSQPDKGSTFTMTLPMLAEAA